MPIDGPFAVRRSTLRRCGRDHGPRARSPYIPSCAFRHPQLQCGSATGATDTMRAPVRAGGRDASHGHRAVKVPQVTKAGRVRMQLLVDPVLLAAASAALGTSTASDVIHAALLRVVEEAEILRAVDAAIGRPPTRRTATPDAGRLTCADRPVDLRALDMNGYVEVLRGGRRAPAIRAAVSGVGTDLVRADARHSGVAPGRAEDGRVAFPRRAVPRPRACRPLSGRRPSRVGRHRRPGRGDGARRVRSRGAGAGRGFLDVHIARVCRSRGIVLWTDDADHVRIRVHVGHRVEPLPG